MPADAGGSTDPMPTSLVRLSGRQRVRLGRLVFGQRPATPGASSRPRTGPPGRTPRRHSRLTRVPARTRASGSARRAVASPSRAAPCRARPRSFCVAVGQYMDSGGFRQAVIETDTNGTWTASTAALPSDAATDATVDHPNNELFSVSCASPTSCVAVGRYADQAGNGKALVDTLSGSSWSGVAAPLPTGASPTNNTLLGISCASPTSCAARRLPRQHLGRRPRPAGGAGPRRLDADPGAAPVQRGLGQQPALPPAPDVVPVDRLLRGERHLPRPQGR